MALLDQLQKVNIQFILLLLLIMCPFGTQYKYILVVRIKSRTRRDFLTSTLLVKLHNFLCVQQLNRFKLG